jgi:hypothetical protein
VPFLTLKSKGKALSLQVKGPGCVEVAVRRRGHHRSTRAAGGKEKKKKKLNLGKHPSHGIDPPDTNETLLDP